MAENYVSFSGAKAIVFSSAGKKSIRTGRLPVSDTV
jgi:hypothetical protein